MRLPIILIGPGLLFLSCDPEESFQDHLYQRVFKNVSNQEIKLVYHSLGNGGDGTVTDTLVLPPNTKKQDFFESGYSSDGVKGADYPLIIEDNVSVYNTTAREVPKFQLYLGNEFIKEWSGIADYLGDEINSPYNFNSWEIMKFEEILEPDYNLFIYGEIIFTITNTDIE